MLVVPRQEYGSKAVNIKVLRVVVPFYRTCHDAPMCALRLLSETVPKVTGKIFARKYIALGRIVTHWEDIIGAEMAEIAQPLKIHYRKASKNGKKSKQGEATLDIAASSADSMLLSMQKGVILERINQVFGNSWITDLRFVHVTPDKPAKAPKRVRPPLSEEDKKYIAESLEEIEDPDIKKRLESFGAAILQDIKE